ncbi:uncharacterized protein EAE98_012146 [Botrytis deweyae]|uniref:Uncharacterized protein n=1 Tax=Botrytis deweyae TaxID=2478750 RepID=A0ABQ7I3X8_9HELO|nr:uncharacterized protein EAE98_012146 [Botrytis deweyae]KAF7910330.1 hypothetical protein EAE98_012146 [Botrytis deweyae]
MQESLYHHQYPPSRRNVALNFITQSSLLHLQLHKALIMIRYPPYIDNRPVYKNEPHRYHTVKSNDLHGPKISRQSFSPWTDLPNIHFKTRKVSKIPTTLKNTQMLALLKQIPDFLKSHHLILLKKIKSNQIKSSITYFNVSIIRILRNAISRIRYILYFLTSSDRKSAFDKWRSVSISKEPKEPKEPKTKVITLESLDDRPLHAARKKVTRMSRNNTQDSITPIDSQKSTNGAYKRLQDRS